MFSQVEPPCLTRLLGHRLNLAAPFLAWEMLSARCAGGWCLDTVPKGTLPARCARLSAVSHGPSDCRRGTQLPFPLSAFPPTGPCFFLSCPIGIEDFRTWFIDLWNNSIIPYLQEGAKDGLKVVRAAGTWEHKPVRGHTDTAVMGQGERGGTGIVGAGDISVNLCPVAVVGHSTVLGASGCHVAGSGLY